MYASIGSVNLDVYLLVLKMVIQNALNHIKFKFLKFRQYFNWIYQSCKTMCRWPISWHRWRAKVTNTLLIPLNLSRLQMNPMTLIVCCWVMLEEALRGYSFTLVQSRSHHHRLSADWGLFSCLGSESRYHHHRLSADWRAIHSPWISLGTTTTDCQQIEGLFSCLGSKSRYCHHRLSADCSS